MSFMFTRRCFTTFSIENLLSGLKAGDRSALARSITLIESQHPQHRKQAQELLSELPIPSGTIRIGITGSPGVGKSTLIEKFGLYCISLGHRVATLAIDPTSLKSGGSILGDKTRMNELSNHPKAFIRPSPSRGHLGGVARYTFDSIQLCEAAGFDVVFIETVGVGQSELMVADLTDIFVLIVAPGAGDELQGMKKGITEAADLILVNKADSPGAKQTLLEYKSAFQYGSESISRQILPVSGHTGEGIEVVWKAIDAIKESISNQIEEKRHGQREKWIWQFTKDELIDRFENSPSVQAIIREKGLDVSKIIKVFCKEELNKKC